MGLFKTYDGPLAYFACVYAVMRTQLTARPGLASETVSCCKGCLMSSPTSRHAHPAKQERSQRNLERIVLAAETVLSRDGWDAFTMKAVADEADASVGGIYRRFANKEQLLRAIKDNVLTRADAMHRNIASTRRRTSPTRWSTTAAAGSKPSPPTPTS